MNESRTSAATAVGVVPPSQRLLSFFRLYLVWYLRRHFHALRMANGNRFPSAEKIIVYINHPSWWDPITIMMVSHHLLPAGRHYGPMDAKALDHYGLLHRMGAFPVATDSATGVLQFLSSSRRVLDDDGVLWITPEGRFTDTRSRPVMFKSGLARLVSQLGRITLVPVAFEYTYWNERLPEILVNCGEPLRIADGRLEEPGTWNNLMSYAMTSTLEELAQLAATRESSNFETVLSGGTGISGMYEYWKRLQTALTGVQYHAEHGSLHKR